MVSGRRGKGNSDLEKMAQVIASATKGAREVRGRVAKEGEAAVLNPVPSRKEVPSESQRKMFTFRITIADREELENVRFNERDKYGERPSVQDLMDESLALLFLTRRYGQKMGEMGKSPFELVKELLEKSK